MCSCEQGTCLGGCGCGCSHTPPSIFDNKCMKPYGWEVNGMKGFQCWLERGHPSTCEEANQARRVGAIPKGITPDERAARFFESLPDDDPDDERSIEEVIDNTLREQHERINGVAPRDGFPRVAGVWVVWTYDIAAIAVCVFGSELAALRFANEDSSLKVAHWPFGTYLESALSNAQ